MRVSQSQRREPGLKDFKLAFGVALKDTLKGTFLGLKMPNIQGIVFI